MEKKSSSVLSGGGKKKKKKSELMQKLKRPGIASRLSSVRNKKGEHSTSKGDVKGTREFMVGKKKKR